MTEHAPEPLPQSAAAGVNEIEGFLLLQAEYDVAQRDAQYFTERMPWLTTAQAEDVARQYLAERTRLTEQTLSTIVRRTRQLRDDYEARYALLQARTLKLSAAALCAALLWTSGLTTWMY
ncbi:hypothetical protein ACFYQQ_28405 [Streptomyces sp. NPDC005496]|uniref:hypothetical protein n=1 Tax=unclassified Streptomyces TaxID=2593676 RepID=UPI0033A8A379